jgi:hypothetical protein
MTDTSPNIKELQLKIWLAKSPMERLRQFLIDNEALYQFWNDSKKKIEKRMLPRPLGSIRSRKPAFHKAVLSVISYSKFNYNTCNAPA